MKNIFKDWRVIVAFLLSIVGGGSWYYTDTNEPEPTLLQSALTTDANLTIISTPMDSINPEMPLKVYRVHYLTYRDFEVSGQGLPTYKARDHYNEVRLFAVRGRLNWNKLNEIDTMVVKVFQPVVFLGEQ